MPHCARRAGPTACRSRRSPLASAAMDKQAGIQVARAAAAVGILYFHSWVALVRFPEGRAYQIPIWTDYGYLAVDLFFAISGYVICLVVTKPQFRPVSFLVKRVFRLYPLWLRHINGLCRTGPSLARSDRNRDLAIFLVFHHAVTDEGATIFRRRLEPAARDSILRTRRDDCSDWRGFGPRCVPGCVDDRRAYDRDALVPIIPRGTSLRIFGRDIRVSVGSSVKPIWVSRSFANGAWLAVVTHGICGLQFHCPCLVFYRARLCEPADGTEVGRLARRRILFNLPHSPDRLSCRLCCCKQVSLSPAWLAEPVRFAAMAAIILPSARVLSVSRKAHDPARKPSRLKIQD